MQIWAVMMLSESLSKDAYNHLIRSDEVLAPIVIEFGLRDVRPKRKHHFDTLVSSIIGQQLSVRAASTIQRRVAVLVGESRPFRPEGI